jgi:DNA-binding NarL/FixJ family response regulator
MDRPRRPSLVLTPGHAGMLASHGEGRRAHARSDGLTTREIDVLRRLGAGSSNREIAEQLFLSENTAASHVRNILGEDRRGQPDPGGHLRVHTGLL